MKCTLVEVDRTASRLICAAGRFCTGFASLTV